MESERWALSADGHKLLWGLVGSWPVSTRFLLLPLQAEDGDRGDRVEGLAQESCVGPGRSGEVLKAEGRSARWGAGICFLSNSKQNSLPAL